MASVRPCSAAIAAILAIQSCVLGAAPEEARSPHWSDSLKGIELGPFRLDVGGSVRFRYEYQNDFNIQSYADERRPGLRSDHFVLQRTRLDFDLHLGETARVYTEIQDARAYESNFGKDDFAWGCPYWNPLTIRQAYVEWRRIGSSPFGVKIGRQAIHYGDNRIWGPGEWGNVGRYTWDAAKLIVETDVAEVHGIFANRVAYDPHSFDEHDSRLDAYGVYAMIKKLPCTLDLFWVGKHTKPVMVANAMGDLVDLDTHTVGVYVDGKAGKGWDYRGTLAHTFGERNGIDVDAFGGNARVGYTFDVAWQPRVGLEYSFATGGAGDPGDDYETFDGVFGAIDRMYGRINFLSWRNLEDYQASVSVRPLPRTRVAVDYHIFRLENRRDAWYWCNNQPARRDPTGAAGSNLGEELDVTASYRHSDHLEFKAGYAHFFAGSFIERTGQSPDADWFFLQTEYSF